MKKAAMRLLPALLVVLSLVRVLPADVFQIWRG